MKLSAASLWFWSGVLLLLNGCINLGEGTRSTNFYLLPSLVDRNPSRTDSPTFSQHTIMVGPISLSGHLDRNQIVTRTPQGRLELAEFDRWAEPLSDQLPRVLRENLEILLPGRRVVDFHWQEGSNTGRHISLEVRRFEGVLGEKLLVDLSWSVREPGSGHLLEIHPYRSEMNLTGGGYLELVDALGRSLEQVSRDVAERLRAAGNPS